MSWPRRPTPPPTPVGARNSPKTSRSASAHSPGRAAGMGQRDGGLHHVAPGAVVLGHPAQLVERPAHGGGVPPGPPALDVLDLLRLDPGVDLEDVAGRVVADQRRGSGLGEAVHADHLLLPQLDPPHPLRLAAHQAPLELVDGREGAAHLLHVVELGPGRLHQLGRLGLDDVRALEDVVVLEQVGLEGQHLLHPQRPLLVPRAGQAEGLVPSRQLQGPGPCVLRQRDAELLEHDALHVVLGLLLGQAERVDLHAVAEAAQLGIGDVVALAADAVPEPGEGPHLARLLDEADARVHEEADPPDHGGDLRRRRSCPNRARRRARRWRWPARRRSPAPASPPPPAGGSCRR